MNTPKTLNRGGGLSARPTLLLACSMLALSACAHRDITRARQAVPHKSPSAPTTQADPTPPRAPTPPSPPTPPTSPTPPQAPTPPAPHSNLREVFPHVRVDAAAKLVEIDAVIPINAKDPQKPRTYLEVIACPPDTKEHEAVLLTKARPSHVHAALLLVGLEPGSPGQWNWDGETLQTVPPKGPPVTITASYEQNGNAVETNPGTWVLDVTTNKTLAELEPDQTWLFAGSQMIQRQSQDTYRADADGTLIGLHTFGGETLAWPRMYNPDSGLEEPHWIANAATLPPYNTPVVVRIRPASPPAAQP